ncbi:MAG: DUF354 domain-containing protein [Gaiellaceae bacterium]
MKVWIDCSNSPHPLLFAPVARELETRGHHVVVTVRDHAQTMQLARERWPEAEIIDGRRVSVARAATAAELATRAVALYRWARRARPDVALSHNSYAQLAAARSARVPAVTAMDYEYQPMNHLAFRLARRILLPSIFPAALAERQGARRTKVVRYDGQKEELYLGDFEPDPDILAKLGVERRDVLVVARSGATRAAYHGYQDRLFMDALARLARRPEVIVVVLARHPEHRREIAALEASNVVLPTRAVDTRSLLCEADAFVGAGGTMTREAALLGTPTWSVFGGEPPAVDRWLDRQGLLRTLADVGEVDAIVPRTPTGEHLDGLRMRGRLLVDLFADVTVLAAQ